MLSDSTLVEPLLFHHFMLTAPLTLIGVPFQECSNKTSVIPPNSGTVAHVRLKAPSSQSTAKCTFPLLNPLNTYSPSNLSACIAPSQFCAGFHAEITMALQLLFSGEVLTVQLSIAELKNPIDSSSFNSIGFRGTRKSINNTAGTRMPSHQIPTVKDHSTRPVLQL